MGVLTLNIALRKLTPALIFDWIADIVLNDEEYLVEKNKEQLKDGRYSTGVFLPEYSKFTIKIKENKGFDFNNHKRIQLFDDGDFQDGIFIEVQSNQILFDSADSKTAMLLERYDKEPLGITEENMIIYVKEHLKPKLIEKFNGFISKSI